MTAPLAGRPVRAVLFDYGGTLVAIRRPTRALHAAYTEIRALVSAGTGPVTEAPAALIVAVHDAVDEAVSRHRGSGALREIDLDEVYAACWAALGRPLPDALLARSIEIEQRAWLAGVRPVAGAVRTLTALRRRGLRLGICSNAPYRAAAMHAQVAALGLQELVDSVTFSSQVGWRKPSPRIFERALAELGAAPETTVMVGDSATEDAAGARAAGMRSVLVAPAGAPGAAAADAAIDRLDRLPALLP